MVLSESSLSDLNTRVKSPKSIKNFRPNIVVKDSKAYDEVWHVFMRYEVFSVYLSGSWPQEIRNAKHSLTRVHTVFSKVLLIFVVWIHFIVHLGPWEIHELDLRTVRYSLLKTYIDTLNEVTSSGCLGVMSHLSHIYIYIRSLYELNG